MRGNRHRDWGGGLRGSRRETLFMELVGFAAAPTVEGLERERERGH